MHTVNDLLTELEALRIRETNLIQAIREAIAEENRGETEVTTVPPFKVGDRVRVLNFVRPPILRIGGGTGYSTEEDQIATIYKISEDRVSIKTDSGIKTWRISANLERLE